MKDFTNIEDATHNHLNGDIFLQGEKPHDWALMWVDGGKYWGTSIFVNIELEDAKRFKKIGDDGSIIEQKSIKNMHKVYSFSSVFYGEYSKAEEEMLVDVPYLLIERKVELVSEVSDNLAENSYFYKLNKDLSVDLSRVYKANTKPENKETTGIDYSPRRVGIPNIDYANATVLGEIEIETKCSPMIFYQDFMKK